MLFYENEPDAIELTPTTTTSKGCNKCHKQAIDALPQYEPYAFIPYLHSSPPSSTPEPFPSFHLHNTSTWTYCGPLLSPCATFLPASFSTWAAASISSPSALLQRLLPLLSFVQTFLEDAGAKHYWLTIRATKPTSEYDAPRWHVDEDFFEEGMGLGMNAAEGAKEKKDAKEKPRRWKLATTLLGPQTLFQTDQPTALSTLHSIRQSSMDSLDMASHTCTSIRCLGCATYASHVRCCLASRLSPKSISSPSFGEMCFFRIGKTEGAVHSEPKCDVDRVFVNVVPGTEDELSSLMARWGMTFPRSWCFGVPVNFGLDDVIDSNTAEKIPNDDSRNGGMGSSSKSMSPKESSTSSTLQQQYHHDQNQCLDNIQPFESSSRTQRRKGENKHEMSPYSSISIPSSLNPTKRESGNSAKGSMTANLSHEYTAWLLSHGLNGDKVFRGT